MEVVKRINNNVILSKENQREVILMGKGLGFQRKPGDPVPREAIEKKFYPEEDMTIEQMAMLMTKATERELAVIYKVVKYFKTTIQQEVNPNVFFTLTDHILFSIQRQKNNLVLVNPMRWEIKRIYPQEYAVAVKAVEYIQQELYPEFPEEEAAFLTLHFVNATITEESHQDAYELAKLTNSILKIVRYRLQLELDENSSYFQRFITHIRYYLMRQTQEVIEVDVANPMVELAFRSYPQEKAIAEQIKKFLYEEKGWQVPDIELMYLILHIGNLINHAKIK
ncbi:MAG: PRD domain-containing protein [Enterococcus sp.]